MTAPIQLETSGGVLSNVDMVVQRRDSPRRLRNDDDDDDEFLLKATRILLYRLPLLIPAPV